MGAKMSVSDLKGEDLKGKRVLVRVGLNVPLDDNLQITDDNRIRAAAPTISYLLGHRAKVILCSHLELDYLVGAVSNPKRPFAAIVGGSKVSEKIGVIESLLPKVDILLLGGGMIFTFYKAQGHAVGSSPVEEYEVSLAKSVIEKAKEKGVYLKLPTDVVIADVFAANAHIVVVPACAIPEGWMGVDVGLDSIKTFSQALDTAKTIIWNGPMGVFELEDLAAVTEAIAHKLAELSGKGVTTIIVGDDTVAAVEMFGLADNMSHVSTGGGASLELLEGKPLPGVLAFDDAELTLSKICKICKIGGLLLFYLAFILFTTFLWLGSY